MTNTKDYILSELLPEKSIHERELWIRKRPMIQKCIEVTEEYAQEYLEENNTIIEVDDIMDELNIQTTLEKYKEGYNDEDDVIEEIKYQIKNALRNIYR